MGLPLICSIFLSGNSFAANVPQFGEWIEPDVTPLGAVLFYPPATGDKGPQREEALKLKNLGYASLLYRPPYLREEIGGMADPAGERLLWAEAKREFPLVIDSIKQKMNG